MRQGIRSKGGRDAAAGNPGHRGVVFAEAAIILWPEGKTMRIFHIIPALAASLMLVLAGCDRESPPPADGVLLDVRTEEEFKADALAGARNIPYDQLETKAAAELPDRDTPVKLYCRSGRRSAIAATTLRRLGYTRIYDLGGLENARSILEKRQ